MTKEIQLTRGQVALVDDDDYERINQFKWYARWSEPTQSYYAVRSIGGRKNHKMISMASIIMNTPIGMVCDHVNHNTLDNRKNNLRNCTRSQNMINRRRQSNNTTGCKGVYRNTQVGYDVRVKLKGKIVFYKWFKTLEDAIQARREAAKKYHGEFYHE